VSGGVLVAGIGNIFRSDDGFGCGVARLLAEQPLPEHVTVTDYGIRGMHLAYDLLDGYDGLVIVDALARGGAPGDIVVLQVGAGDLGSGDFDAHGMEPTAVLASLGRLGGSLPTTYVVGCEPSSVDEAMGLSAPVAAAVPRAVETVVRLVHDELAPHHLSREKESAT